MNLGRLTLLFVVAFGLTVSPALAQDKPSKTPLNTGVKPLKPGPLPSPPRRPRLPERPIKGKSKSPDKGKTPTRKSPPPARAKSRRAPPGGAAAPSAVDASANTPAWQQVDADADAEPTLSKDFIRNCAKLKPGVKVNLDIYDEDLEAVVKLIACLTGQNIILSKAIKGKKITIYSPKQVTAREAYRAFLTALEANGYTISKQGNFLRIIDIKQYATSPDPMLSTGRTPPNEDRMVTQIVQLQHIDAAELNEVLSKLATQHAQFIVYQPDNSLIITELSSNLRKLKGLIQQLDQPGGQEELWVYQVLHADAAEIASKILELFEKDGSGGGTAKKTKRKAKVKSKNRKATSSKVGESDLDASVSKVITDERTNRLLVVASRKSYRKVKALIQKLDIPIEGDGQIHILQLNHAKAADLANVLGNLSNEARNRRNQRSGNRRSNARSPRASANANSAAGGAALFEGEVSITADEDTNSMVITASLKDFLALKRVVDELDRPRRQVFIEAVIMEVTINSNRQFGINTHLGIEGPNIGPRQTGVLFSNQPEGQVSSFDLLTSAASLTGIGMQMENVEIVPGFSLPPFGVVLQALARNDDVNVLSTPHILTTDNQEAEIVVGENVPFPTNPLGGLGSAGALLNNADSSALNSLGSLGGLGGVSSFLPTVTRQDVALTLKITPRINAANFVTLEIDQEVEEVAGSSDLGPTTTKRSIKSTVVVSDQNTVVIGGLQKSKQTADQSGVPFLSEIPVLGYFFRRSSSTNNRVNLLLMLTPYVIEGPEDFRAIFQRKMEEHREFVSRFQKRGDEYVLGIDYGKKHGLLESINQSLTKARDEEQLLEELRNRDKGPPLPQELDGVGAGEDEPQGGDQAVVPLPDPRSAEALEGENLGVEPMPPAAALAEAMQEQNP